MTIQERYQRLLDRRMPTDERLVKSASESFEGELGTNTKYLIGAMRPVGRTYTQRLVEQGDRVENQLRKRLASEYPEIEFRRQGSVSNLTHIRYFSDVDVLTIIDRFYTLQQPQQAPVPYRGDPVADLGLLRARCVEELSEAFPMVKIDDSGSTALTLMRSASLLCSVDVVAANWFDSNDYARSRAEVDRGVCVLNKETGQRPENYPFRFNHRIAEHDRSWNRVPRMLIRLLKTVKADIEEEENDQVDFSSFDICSLVYRLPHPYGLEQPLELLRSELLQMFSLVRNEGLRAGLKVVDDSRDIFDGAGKVTALVRILVALYAIWDDALKEHANSGLHTQVLLG